MEDQKKIQLIGELYFAHKILVQVGINLVHLNSDPKLFTTFYTTLLPAVSIHIITFLTQYDADKTSFINPANEKDEIRIRASFKLIDAFFKKAASIDGIERSEEIQQQIIRESEKTIIQILKLHKNDF